MAKAGFNAAARLGGNVPGRPRQREIIDDVALTEELRQFDFRAGAGEQFTRDRIDQNKKSAEKFLAELDLAGVEGGRERKMAEDILETGAQKDESWFLSTLEKIDIPLRVVKAGLLDATGLDNQVGQEINFWDSVKSIVTSDEEGIRRNLGKFAGERADLSTDAIFRSLGWDNKNANLGNKFLRGAAHFAVDVALDPISWLTGGLAAVGKKTALATTSQLIRQSADEAINHAIRGVGREAASDAATVVIRDRMDEIVQNPQRLTEIMQKIGREAAEDIDQDAITEMVWRAIGRQAEDDVLAPIAKAVAERDFAKMPDWFRKSQKVKEQAPWLQGGIRPTLPLGGGFKGVAPIPGTVGLGRRINRAIFGSRAEGTRLAGALQEKGLFDRVERLLTRTDANRIVYGLARTGDPTKMPEMRLFMQGVNTAAKEMNLDAVQHAAAHTAHQWARLSSKLKTEELDAANRVLNTALHGDVFDENVLDDLRRALPASLDDEARESAIEFAQMARNTYDELHRMARGMDMDIGFQKGYLPLVWDRDFRRFLNRLVSNGTAVNVEDFPEELRQGAAWLAETVAAVGRKGNGRNQKLVGETAHARERQFGMNAQVQDIGDITIFNAPELVEVGFENLNSLNDQMLEAAQWLASKQGIALKKGAAPLQLDPAEQLISYMASMSAALQERWWVRQLAEVGALQPASFRTDLARMLGATMENLGDPKFRLALNKKVQEIVDALVKADGALANPYQESQSVYIGPIFGTIEVPKNVVESERVSRALNKLRQREAAWSASKTTVERATKRAYEQLRAKGVGHDEAALLAAQTSHRDAAEVLRAARDDLQEQARELADDLAEITERFGDESAEALKLKREAVKAQRQIVRTAERNAARSRAALGRQIDRNVRKVAQTRRHVADFDSEEARAALASKLADEVVAVISSIDENFTEIRELRGAVDAFLSDGNFEALSTALRDLLRRTRATIEEINEVDPKVLLRARGTATEWLASQHAPQGMIPKGYVKMFQNLGSTQGETRFFDAFWEFVNNRRSAARQLARTDPKRAALWHDYLDKMEGQYSRVMEQQISRAEATWRFREWLQGHELYEQVELLRKLTAGQNIYSHPSLMRRLRVMLNDMGMIPEGHKLTRKKGGLGFEIVEEIDFAPTRVLTQELKRLGYNGIPAQIDPADLNKLSDAAQRTYRALDNLPDDVARINQLEELIDEGFRHAADIARAESGEEIARKVATAAVRANRAIADFDSQVLRIFRKKTASLKELEAATTAFATMKRNLEKVLSPAERVLLDSFDDLLSRRRAIAEAADGMNPDVKNAIDAAIDYRKQMMFDPEATAESFASIFEELSRRQTTKDIDEWSGAVRMLDELTQVLGKMLGLTLEPDGSVRRGFLNADDEKLLGKAIERGNKIWKRLMDTDGPFENARVPVPERPGFVAPSNYKLGGEVWEGLLGDRYALQWMENWVGQQMALNTPEGLSSFIGGFRTMMNWWKAMATVARPTFHIRNVLGGFYNGQMADVGLKWYKFAIQHTNPFLKNLRRYSDLDQAIAELPEAAQPYFRAAWDAGVFDDTFASTEILSRQLARRSKQRFNPASTSGPLVTAGGNVMTSLEGNMRMAVFARHFNPQATDLVASATTAKTWVDMVHFNYSELTNMEQWAKNYIPFFVWFRRNLPLQMRALIERPAIMQRYNHLIGAINGQSEVEDQDLPPNMYRQRQIYATVGTVNEDTDFWSAVIFDPDLPPDVLFEIENPLNPSSWASLTLNQLGPQFDLLAQAVANDDDYYMTAPGGMGQLLNWLPVPGADRTEFGVARTSPLAGALYNTIFPPLKEIGGFAFETDPRRRQALGQLPITSPEGVDEEDTWLEDLKAFGWTLARGAGVQLQGVDDSYVNTAVSDMALSDARKELKDRGVITPDIENIVEEMVKQKEGARSRQRTRF